MPKSMRTMNIMNAKIVPDLRVFEVMRVSRDHGRKRLKALITKGEIEPLKTPTGRFLLSFEEAKTLARKL